VNLRQSIEALIRDYDGDEPTPEGFRDLMRDLRNTLVDCRDNEPRPGGGSRYTAPMASVSPASLAENELDRREALHREEDLAEVLMRVHDHLHLTPQAPADELLDCIAAVLDRQKDSLEHATEAMLKSANINQQRASEVGFDECGDCGEPPKHCHCEHRPSEARSSDVHHTCPYGSPGFFPNCNACVIEMQRGVSKSMHMGWSACTNEAQIEAVTVPREGSRTLAVNGGLVSLEWSGDASMKTIAEAGQKLVDSLKPCTDNPSLSQARLEERALTLDEVCRWLRERGHGVAAECAWQRFRLSREDVQRAETPLLADKASYALGWDAAVEQAAKTAEATQPVVSGYGGTSPADYKTFYEPNPYAACCAANIRKLKTSPTGSEGDRG
jgi:hypothetical protein